jgi:hypothetical protein
MHITSRRRASSLRPRVYSGPRRIADANLSSCIRGETVRAVCIARHRFLSEHICSVFGALGLDTRPAVGFDEGMTLARAQVPDVVLCEYDVLATSLLDSWAADPVLSETPIIAVSLTRRHDEAPTVGGPTAGFLYLPTLTDEDANIALRAMTRRVRPPRDVLRWDPVAEEMRIE